MTVKTPIFILCALLAGIGSALAGFSEQRLENAKRSAKKSGKLVAFIFYQDFYAPRCPKCISSVSAANNGAKKALPRADVVVVEIYKGDQDLDRLPACVPQGGPTPRVVITDADCTKVIEKYNGSPNRERTKEVEAKTEEALGKTKAKAAD